MPFQHTDTLSSLGTLWTANDWKLRENSGVCLVFPLPVCSSENGCCWCLGCAGQCGPVLLVQAGFYLSSVEKLFLSETWNAEVLEGMGATVLCLVAFLCFCIEWGRSAKNWFTRRVLHDSDQLWLQECLKSTWRQSASLLGLAGDPHIWMSCSWNLSLSVRQIVSRERPALSLKISWKQARKKNLLRSEYDCDL